MLAGFPGVPFYQAEVRPELHAAWREERDMRGTSVGKILFMLSSRPSVEGEGAIVGVPYSRRNLMYNNLCSSPVSFFLCVLVVCRHGPFMTFLLL